MCFELYPSLKTLLKIWDCKAVVSPPFSCPRAELAEIKSVPRLVSREVVAK